jgi:hypothetical protein
MRGPTQLPPLPPGAAGMLNRAINTLTVLYKVLPAEVRLVMAQYVADWAEKARAEALQQMGLSEEPQPAPPPGPPAYTTTGHRA